MATPSLAMIPSAYADSKVYSVLPNNGDGDFTFNRDSSATRIGQNGLIQTVGYFGNELVTNGDYTNGLTGWATQIPSGQSVTVTSNQLRINYDSGATQGSTGVNQTILTASVKVEIVIDIASITGTLRIQAGGQVKDISTTGIHKFEKTPTSTILYIIRSANASSLDVTINSISIKEVQGDQPRLNYDISNGVVQSCPSLLLEPASTNVIPYSEDFSNAAWSKTNLTVTDNQTTSPDGSLNASKLTEDTSTGEHKIFDSLSITSGVDYTFSVFVKSNGRNFIRLRLENAGVGSGQINVWFDVLNGAVGTVGAGTAIIENYGNGWYRCIATGTTSATSYVAQINLSDADNNVSYTGDGASGIYLFGAMLEELSYATSYIPTLSGAIQTRAAETCNDAGTSSTFNSTEGVLYAEISGLALAGGDSRISLSDSTLNNRISFAYSPTASKGYIIVKINGVSVINNLNVEIGNHLDIKKIAISYKSGDTKVFLNGVELSIASSVSFSGGVLNDLSFESANSSVKFYGNVKDIRVYNEALTDAQLQTLTTL